MRIHFGDCVLDTDSRELWRGGGRVHLAPKAFRLLEVLLANRPRAIAKSELLDLLWPGTFVAEASLTSLINEVRTALGEVAREPRFLRTVHGFGYAFSGDAMAQAPRRPDQGPPVSFHRLIWEGREIALQPGENLLGRDPVASVWIDDPSVSRRHARIVVANGTATLEDLGSKNGSWVEESRVTAAVPLSDGDRLRIGWVALTYRVFAAPGSTETRPDL